MKKLTAILVDDEESARDVLSNLLTRFCPGIELIGKYADVATAVEVIKKQQPDVVFLDIEMPNYAGYEIVSFFDEINFEMVFITAYDKYAIKAFEISAVDYLLKPIDIERLKNAVDKLHQKTALKNREQVNLLTETLKTNEVKSIIVSDKGYQTKIELANIIAFEANESYCCIHALEKKYIASKNLKHFESILSDNVAFFRAHKSWLVNTDFIVNYSKSNLEINLEMGLVAKLSKYKKAEFETVFVS